MELKPFFTFYGGKWRAAPYYPAPRHETIVEPFAGSAGYSLRHSGRRVVLVERDPVIAATWRYLLAVTPSEVLKLPDLELHQTVDDLKVCEEARLLVGWWLNGGSAQPKKRPSMWMRKQAEHGGPGWATGGGQLSWSRRVRERIATQVEHIRHWKLIEGNYRDAGPWFATWFIDPPYKNAGKHYRFHDIDYESLAKYCRSRLGQVIACENVGASWLPFKSWRHTKASNRHGVKFSHEAIWLNDSLQ